ncbi:MAG: VOC family protein [Elusimicrobia bacterium]|nr:VOC family protein [Candidatus Liberimonas magnetica]
MNALRHVGIVVNNMDKAISFYRDILGLKIKRDMIESGEFIDNILSLEGVKVRTVKMSIRDGGLIELLYFESHPCVSSDRELYGIGYSHIALTVNNLDYEYDRLNKIGIVFSSTPKISPDGKAKVVFCQDPEGNQIELVEELN